MDKKQSITPRQLVFVLVGSQVAVAFLSLPRVAAEQAGQDAWIAVLLGAIIPLLALFLIERLGRQVPELSFVKMARLFLGKFAGTISILVFIAYVIFILSIVIRIFCEITSEYLLPRTPLAVIALLTMLGIVYIISQGAQVIGRINELLFYLLLPVLLILLVPLPVADVTNLLPVGTSGLPEMAHGVFRAAFAYSGVEVLLIFYFFVDRKEAVMKAGFIATMITACIYLTITVISLMVFGADILQNITWPGLYLMKVIPFPTIQRMELFFLAVWMGMGVRPAVNLGFAASYSFCELFNLNMNKYFIWVVVGITASIYLLSLYPHNILITFHWAQYACIAFPVIGVAYPLILHAGALLQGKKVRIYV